MKSFNRIFFRGLVTLIPIAITVYVVVSAVKIFENLLGEPLRDILPAYVPGLGLVITVALIYVFGLLLNNLIAGRVLGMLEQRFNAVPFIKAIYSPLKDLMNLFSKKEGPEMNRVVLVRLGDQDAYAMGLVTRESFKDLEMAPFAEGKVAVYFPFSYGLGGYTFLVPKTSIREVNIPVDKAMSLAITGWVKVDP
ncbi:MAG: DUF502 domain-containing protein [Bdellovibrio sp.]